MDDDPELAHAIAASLASMQGGSSTGPGPTGASTSGASGGASSSAIPGGAPKTQSKLGLLSHPVDCTAPDSERAAMPGNGGADVADRLPRESDDKAVVELVVKMPDNKRVQASFRRADRVGYLTSWLHGLGWDMKEHRLCRSYPKATLDVSLRLQDVGIQSREMLIVERIT